VNGLRVRAAGAKTLCAGIALEALAAGRSTSPLEVSLLRRWRPYCRMARDPYVGYTFDGEPQLRVGSGQGRAEPAKARRGVCGRAARFLRSGTCDR